MRFDGGYDEAYMALLNKGLMSVGEDGLFEVGGVDVGTIIQLKKFSSLVKEFVTSSGEAFEVCSSKDGYVKIVATPIGKKFVRLIRESVSLNDNVYVLEPYSALIMEEINFSSIYALFLHVELSWSRMEVFDFLNGYVDHIRAKACSGSFKAKLNSYHRSANKNYRELIKYERRLFEVYSRILVVRLDLSYKKIYCNVDQKVALQHRKRFFDSARSNKLFKHMVGYVTKLEHGIVKGFHFHCVFFFNGAKVREDITMAKLIGEYWEMVVTKGKGGYYNCNNAKQKYRKCGIGMITHSDMDMREGLRLALVYLTKTDLYMKLKAEGRALTKGVMPGVPSGRGRPRKAPETV